MSAPYATEARDRIPVVQKIAFGLGMATPIAFVNSVAQLTNLVFNIGLGVSPIYLGLAQLVPRLWDAVTGPLAGYISDNTRSRWGRRRPYIFLGGIATGFFYAAIWYVPPGGFRLELPQMAGIERIGVNGRPSRRTARVIEPAVTPVPAKANSPGQYNRPRHRTFSPEAHAVARTLECGDDGRHPSNAGFKRRGADDGVPGPGAGDERSGLETGGKRDSYLLQRPLMCPLPRSPIFALCMSLISEGSCSAMACMPKWRSVCTVRRDSRFGAAGRSGRIAIPKRGGSL